MSDTSKTVTLPTKSSESSAGLPSGSTTGTTVTSPPSLPIDRDGDGGAGSTSNEHTPSTLASDGGQAEKDASQDTTISTSEEVPKDTAKPERPPSSPPTVTAGSDEDSEDDSASDAAKPRRKKLSSKKRKSLRRARELEAASSANSNEQSGKPEGVNVDMAEEGSTVKSGSPSVAIIVDEPAHEVNASPSDDPAQPRRKKLSSKQRRSQRKAREAEQQLLQLDPQEQKKPQDVVPASAPQKKAASAPVPSVNKAATMAAPAKPSTPAPGQSAAAYSALRGILTVLHQTLQAEGQLACVNSGATKASVMREVTRLGYTCVEGRPAQVQYVQWNQTHHSFEVSRVLRDQPDKFPQTSKSKGDIKLLDPALFLRCRCIPAFGAESPEQMGLQVFKSTFLQFVEEVAVGESDAFVFAAAVSEYVDFVQQALPALPLARAALSPPVTYALPYVSKRNGACTLQCTVSTAEAANNEIYYAVLITA